MVNKTTELWKKLEGTKTYSGGVLLAIYEIIVNFFPQALNDGQEKTLLSIINFIIFTGVIDKAWRERAKIIEFIKNIFKKKQNG